MKNTDKKNETLIILLAFNEEKAIGKVIDEIIKSSKDVDIAVINDGSSDATADIASQKGVPVINHPFNMGIGTSFETGCRFAVHNNYRYLIRMDADGQHDARFIPEMLLPVKNNHADIVIGSRFLKDAQFTSSSLRLIGIKIISSLLTQMTRKKVTDPTSGFCAMNRKAFEFFSINCCEDYPEPEILVYHKEFRITEVPIEISKRTTGASSITPLKSIYYMIKVILSLIIHFLRR